MRPSVHHSHPERRRRSRERAELQSMTDEEEDVERIHDDDLEAAADREPLVPKHPALDRLRATVRKVIVTRAVEKAGEGARNAVLSSQEEQNIESASVFLGLKTTSLAHRSSLPTDFLMTRLVLSNGMQVAASRFVYRSQNLVHPLWVTIDGSSTMDAIQQSYTRLISYSDVGSLAADQTRESFARCYENHLHIVMHIMSINAKGESENEQMNILVGSNYIITLQESNRPHFAKLADRLAKNGGRIREKGLLYVLVQVLLVCVVTCNPVITYYGDTVENLEISFTFGAKREFMLRVQAVKRELLLLRKAMRPLIEIVDLLPKLHSPMGEKWVQVKDDRKNLKGQLQEVHKRLKASIDLIETYRELCVSIQELSNMDQDHEMNRVLYVLTMVTTIFVPCSFLAGVYGMNFKYFPELQYKWAYPVWWVVVITIMFSLAMLFRYKRWK